MSAKPKKKLVSLGLGRLPVPQLIQNTQHYVTSMTGNANFPTPSPALSIITTAVNLLEGDYDKSLTRVKGSVPIMRTDERALKTLLKALASYVEGIANENANATQASDIIASAGMNEKKPSVKKPKTFTAIPGTIKGTVILDIKAVPRSAYMYEMTTDSTGATGWTTIYMGTKAKFTISALASNTHYYFRYMVSTKGVQGNWSPVIQALTL
jgi:hypothetical protein